MPGPRPRKGPQASGQGVAAAKQLGLFVEFNPEDMLLGAEETEDDGDLEAELLALTGEAGTTGRKPAPKGQAPYLWPILRSWQRTVCGMWRRRKRRRTAWRRMQTC